MGLTGRDRDGFRTFPDGSNLTIQIAARTGGPVDIERHRRHHRVLELDQRRRRRRRPARRLQHDRQLRRVGRAAPAGRARRTQAVRLGGELPGIEPPEEWKRSFDWQRQFRIGSASLSLSAFASGEWFELAQKMFDVTSDNVFVIGTVGEAPNILLTNNDLRKRALGVEDTTTCGNVSTEFAVSNTDWRGNLVAAMSRTTLP